MCGGAGFLRRDLPLDHADFGKAVPCSCNQAEEPTQRLQRLQRYSSLGPLTRKTFDRLAESGRSQNQGDQAAFRALVADARLFAEEPKGWLVIHGPSGAGKTHVAAAIANRCLERGQPAFFVVVPDLLDSLRASYRPDENGDGLDYNQLIEQVRDAPVLLLDDLGTQSSTAWAQEKLFQILNHRYNAQLPTVITTNLSVDRLEERIRMRLTDPELSSVYYVEAATRQVDINLPDSFNLDHIREMTFENFQTSAPGYTEQQNWSLEGAYEAALRFAEKPENWLLLVGTNGCGKTHLAAAIANRCRARGERPVFFVVPDLLDYISQLNREDGGQRFLEGFNQLRNAPLLILDDVSVQSEFPWILRRLFQVIDYRYNARLPTVFTVSAEAWASQLEERLLARLNDPGICTEVPIMAPSYRAELRERPSAFGRPQQAAPRTQREPRRTTPQQRPYRR